MTPFYNRGSLQGNLEDTLRELIPEAMNQHAALMDRKELEASQQLLQNYPVADEVVVHKLFCGNPDRGDLADFNQFVHLPLVRSTSPVMFPVLTFAYDWPRQVLRLRVALFYNVHADEGQPGLRAFGVRFETPECWDADDDSVPLDPGAPGGEHDMFHAQPVSELRQGDPRTRLPALEWLNTTQPSIPVSAQDLSGLVLAMLVSIYGRRQIVERYKARKLQSLVKAAPQVSGFPQPPARPET